MSREAAVRRLSNMLTSVKVGAVLTVPATKLKEVLPVVAQNPQPQWERRLRNLLQAGTTYVEVQAEHLRSALDYTPNTECWVPHIADDRPVDKDQLVCVMVADGRRTRIPKEASAYGWHESYGGIKVVAYDPSGKARSEEEWEQLWVPHIGDKCPVVPALVVWVRLRNGEEDHDQASLWSWGQDLGPRTITHWRPYRGS